MFRLSWLTAITVLAAAVSHGDDRTTDLTNIDRNIHTEPAYEAVPHYALLVFGPRAEQRVWFVLDGDDVAYIDRNGNGDLTEPGERIELDRTATGKINLASTSSVKAMHVFPIGDVAGAKLSFKLWVVDPEYDPLKDKALDDLPTIRAYRQGLRDQEVQQVAVGLAEGTKLAGRLGRCDSRFEIAPYDPDKAETIHQVRLALQKLTKGFVYQTWDQQLSAPK